MRAWTVAACASEPPSWTCPITVKPDGLAVDCTGDTVPAVAIATRQPKNARPSPNVNRGSSSFMGVISLECRNTAAEIAHDDPGFRETLGHEWEMSNRTCAQKCRVIQI